jgi:hypothetical protein
MAIRSSTASGAATATSVPEWPRPIVVIITTPTPSPTPTPSRPGAADRRAGRGRRPPGAGPAARRTPGSSRRSQSRSQPARTRQPVRLRPAAGDFSPLTTPVPHLEQTRDSHIADTTRITRNVRGIGRIACTVSGSISVSIGRSAPIVSVSIRVSRIACTVSGSACACVPVRSCVGRFEGACSDTCRRGRRGQLAAACARAWVRG